MRIRKDKAALTTTAEGVLLPISLFVTFVTFFILLTLAVRPAVSMGTNLGLLVSSERVAPHVDPIRGIWLAQNDTYIASTYASASIAAPVPVEKLVRESPSGKRIIYATFGGVWVTEPIELGESRLSLPTVRILRVERFYANIDDTGQLDYEE